MPSPYLKRKSKKATGVINQAVEENAYSSEEEEDGVAGREAAYTRAYINHLMTLG